MVCRLVVENLVAEEDVLVMVGALEDGPARTAVRYCPCSGFSGKSRRGLVRFRYSR